MSIVEQQNNRVHLHYFDEGNACVNWVGHYYIVNVLIGYCTNEIK
jgi:hypothetical protein